MFSTFTRKANSLGDQSSNMSTCNSHSRNPQTASALSSLCRLHLHDVVEQVLHHRCLLSLQVMPSDNSLYRGLESGVCAHGPSGVPSQLSEVCNCSVDVGALRRSRQQQELLVLCFQLLSERSIHWHLPIDGLLLGRLRSGNLLRRQRGSLA